MRRWGRGLSRIALLVASGACDSNASTLDASAADDAALRFGSHAPCSASTECPDAETCAYAMALGCTATGECVTAYRCTEHTEIPTACLCDGGTRMANAGCWTTPPTYYSPTPIQGLGFCPGDPNAPDASCDGGLPLGAPCDIHGAPCCGSVCVDVVGARCCMPEYAPCSADGDCCENRRCTADNASYKRCVP